MEAGRRKRGEGQRVSEGQVRKAVAALRTWLDARRAARKAQLLDDDDMFYLVVSLGRIPTAARTNPLRIPLPHSLFPADGAEPREVCLLVKDSKGAAPGDAKDKVRKDAIAGVTKVIGVQKLRTKYKPHEAKRQLCGSYDLFVADDRILPLLPKLLGKTFFKKKKHPIPVSLKGSNWAEQIRRACDSTYLYLGSGACCVLRTARTSHSEQEVVDNVMAVIEEAAKLIPRKWSNIKSIYMKTQDSAALPIYAAIPDMPVKIAPIER
eukprot:SM000007S20879  [mRNA]  locus=s7:696898:698265:+ [translate_table: standard]